jgi:hypothetical protein
MASTSSNPKLKAIAHFDRQILLVPSEWELVYSSSSFLSLTEVLPQYGFTFAPFNALRGTEQRVKLVYHQIKPK